MSISKKIRFEVFKRDGFICQYCGKTPPEAILEIDHINPKSKKGTNDINNLITSCFDCNRGKGGIALKTIPNTVSTNLEIIKEKEIQIKTYNKFLERIERRLHVDIEEIDKIYTSYFPTWKLSERFKSVSLKRFLQHLPKQTIKDAMCLACDAMLSKDSIHPEDSAIDYFCGICWNKIKER